jgi:hypothetical protein
MKIKKVKLPTGKTMSVPQGIQRLDSVSTCGWQVRYQGTKYFPDGQAGPKKSLDAATQDLLHRIATLPAPVPLRRSANLSKASGLPVGVSGPIVVSKVGYETLSAVLSVAVPVFGQTNQTKKVYIGTPSTYTKTRYRQALAKAVEIREQGMADYQEAATRAKRAEALAYKKALRKAERGL